MPKTKVSDCTPLLKRYGYDYQVTEHRIYFRGRSITKDFGGFADLLAWRPLDVRSTLSELEPDRWDFRGCLAIQACTHGSTNAHLDKATQGEPSNKLRTWLLAGNRFEIWSFPDRSKKGRFFFLQKTDSLGRTRRVRQLDIRFLRITYSEGFYYEPQTELECFGHAHRENSRSSVC